ncbi:hypothetical protein JCM15831A_14460 [Asaia astilbis]
MTLDEWLNDQGISGAAFARQSGIGFRQIVFRYRNGTSFPRPENMRRIIEATGGKVTPEDFLKQRDSTRRTPTEARP